MAKLHRMGDWVGPGEERTGRYLAKHLPDAWDVVAGRKLPGQNRSDVDFIVIGDNLIFLVEEKHWGPTIVIGDNTWLVNGKPRENPMNGTAHKARAVAGLLKDRIKDFKKFVAKAHVVKPVVVLSRAGVKVMSGPHADPNEQILSLEMAPGELISLDKARETKLKVARESVVKVLLDLSLRSADGDWIGEYRVIQETDAIGRIRCFEAEDPETAERVLLRCYPNADRLDGDPTVFFKRELDALTTLADEGRAWRYSRAFEDEKADFYVVPIIPPRNRRSIYQSIEMEDPERPNGYLASEIALRVVEDGFRGLAAVHRNGLVHRVLAPNRIWLGRGLRVQFSDFYLAKFEDHQTVVFWADEDSASVPFRAPECRQTIQLADTASDVYGLSLILGMWLIGAVDIDQTIVRSRVAEFNEIGHVLAQGLADDPKARPSAEAIAQQLSELRNQPTVLETLPIFEEGSVIEDRYHIRRKLGEGGFGVSWLAYDDGRETEVVLKQLKDESMAAAAKEEFKNAYKIANPRCARVWDIVREPPPGMLVHEYRDGVSIRDRVQDAGPELEGMKKVALETLAILGDLHDQGIVHGDISPGNIIVDDDWGPVLIDFQLVRKIGALPLGGTPGTLAPEVLDGRPVSPQSDLYGLACSLLTLMLGRRPYVGATAAGAPRDSTPLALTSDEREQWGADGVAFLNVLMQGVYVDPADRPESAAAFADLIRMARTDIATDSSPTEYAVNPTVQGLRNQYRGSKGGNEGNRGLDDDFARSTYVPTDLDLELAPAILRGELDAVILSGNPGDGKTAFLVRLRELLIDQGASIERDDGAGWLLQIDGRTFAAVYDASESYEGRSSDDLIIEALEPYKSENAHTAVIAANDGRLLQFFNDFHREFPEIEAAVRAGLESQKSTAKRVVFIDLKKRSLSNFDGSGFARDLAHLVTAQERWGDCLDCKAQPVCPIYANTVAFDDNMMNGIARLVVLSHLKRRRRATMRDLRSALAWIITGDRSCEDVHEAAQDGLDLKRGTDTRIEDLVFSRESNDYLVQEWSDSDPARVISPGLERLLRIEASQQDLLKEDRSIVESRLRRDYLRRGSEPFASLELSPYRYMRQYIEQLQQPSEESRDQILLGMSRLVGAPGYEGIGLAIGEVQNSSGWSVLKTLDSQDFAISVPILPQRFLHAVPDRLMLSHISGNVLDLSLDSFELIMRASDGEIVRDQDSDAIVNEIRAFTDRLQRQTSSEVTVVDPSGVGHQIVEVDGRIERVST